MRLWTIQHNLAYEKMMQCGRLTADNNFLFCENDFRFAYDWMSSQMQDRIGNAPNGIDYPVWAWYQWDGQRKQLDMRKHRKWSAKGTPVVLLTIDVPDNQVLLSDFDAWHFVMNNIYYPKSDADFDNIDCATEQQKVESWNRIFIPNTANSEKKLPSHIQATMWQIKNEWVSNAEHFIST